MCFAWPVHTKRMLSQNWNKAVYDSATILSPQIYLNAYKTRCVCWSSVVDQVSIYWYATSFQSCRRYFAASCLFWQLQYSSLALAPYTIMTQVQRMVMIRCGACCFAILLVIEGWQFFRTNVERLGIHIMLLTSTLHNVQSTSASWAWPLVWWKVI